MIRKQIYISRIEFVSETFSGTDLQSVFFHFAEVTEDYITPSQMLNVVSIRLFRKREFQDFCSGFLISHHLSGTSGWCTEQILHIVDDFSNVRVLFLNNLAPRQTIITFGVRNVKNFDEDNRNSCFSRRIDFGLIMVRLLYNLISFPSINKYFENINDL